jgi:hypothetical protein
MNINLKTTLKAIGNKLSMPDTPENLRKAYGQTLRLRNQLLGVIIDREEFGKTDGVTLADILSDGTATPESVALTIHEPLPFMKELTTTLQLHWTDLIQSAIKTAEKKTKLPYFDKALVWIEVTTPRETKNAQLWDTSNRAVNLIINNIKGIFFDDDNLEHMAFGVSGRWGEEGKTVISVVAFDSLQALLYDDLKKS